MEHGEQRSLNWLIKGTEYTSCDGPIISLTIYYLQLYKS